MANRCIDCAKPKEEHPQPHCAKYKTMDLPEGYTCDDCGHFRFCTQYIGPSVAGNTNCDWYPIRFVLPIPVPKPGTANARPPEGSANAGGKEG